MPYGYVGSEPSQVKRNSGIYSVTDVLDATKLGHFGGSLELITSGVTTGTVTNVNILEIAEDEYDIHYLRYELLRPDTNDRALTMRFYEDLSGTQTLQIGNVYDYGIAYRLGSTTGTNFASNNNLFLMGFNGGNTVPYANAGSIYLYNLGNSARESYITYHKTQMYRTTGDPIMAFAAGSFNRTEKVNGLQFGMYPTSDIAFMKYYLYGVKKVR